MARRLSAQACPTCGRALPRTTVGDTKLARAMFAHRAHRHLTLRQAAADAGINHTTYYRTEAGKVPELATFVRLAKWIGKPMEDLV